MSIAVAGTIPAPSPASIAAAVGRLQTSRTRLPVVTPPTPAAIPHKKRLPSEPCPGESSAVARDRARWIECNHGRHAWIPTPRGTVCQHCPVHEDQAARVRDARRATR